MNTLEPRILFQLQRIVAPVVVGVPPVNAFRELMLLPDGEIRHYGYRHLPNGGGKWVYISSRDCGLSWQEYPTPAGCPGACVQSPWSRDFLTVVDTRMLALEGHATSAFPELDEGVYAARSTGGIDGRFTFSRISEQHHHMIRQPLALRSRKRWIVPCQFRPADGRVHPVVFLSDDDGITWRRVALGTAPAHEVHWPHKGIRWQNWACEPTVVELSTGRLWMLIRTSQDVHYESFSDDGGETWTAPAPSRFYGTITMPTLFRMSDGRILVIWCNTTPLPELDHALQPELEQWERDGFGEDFFTNRDAIHAAISEDDGKTWIGFREVALNPLRDAADFRSSGGFTDCIDKSMHQSQAIELPGGKILLSHGQHEACRKLVIFDPAWLYETARSDDFRTGLGAWSTFQYVRSIAGNFRGFSGHCAYNRRPGAQLMPAPDGEMREVLQIARYPDPRLVHEPQGAMWNFPAGLAGEVCVTLQLPAGGKGIQISLMDRWFNPVDPAAHEFAAYVLHIDADGRIAHRPLRLEHGKWYKLKVTWADCIVGEARLSLDDQQVPETLPLKQPAPNGLCYLHMQSIAEEADLVGTLIRDVAATVRPANRVASGA